MAKNIITLKDNRPDLVADFTKYLSSRKTTTSYYGDFYDDYYDYYDDYGYGYYGGCGNLFPQSAIFPKEDDEDDWDSRWGLDDDDDDDAYANYWNKHAHQEEKKSSSKRGKRGKKNSKKTDDGVISDEELDDILAQKKAIYFYEDIEDEKSVHKFKNLRKFFNFLEDNGIEISDMEGSKFIRADVRHCCLDPLKLNTLNIKEIISDHSYGALKYEVSEDAALFRD